MEKLKSTLSPGATLPPDQLRLKEPSDLTWENSEEVG